MSDDERMDGGYYGGDRIVWKRPLESDTGITLGGPICTLHETVPEGGAEIIAEALNQHLGHGRRIIIESNDLTESVTIHVVRPDGEEIEVGSTSHDESGWQGMDNMRGLAEAIGQALGVPVEERDEEEEET